MNRKMFVERLAEVLNVSKKKAAEILNGVQETFEQGVLEHGSVKLAGFLAMEIKEKAARNGVNPKTKERIVIPAKKVVTVKLANGIKTLVN
jgi:DNA-binding protein HU-beta